MADFANGSNRCSATSKQTGQQCGQPAIPGGTVCRYHGGSAPQVVRSARAKLDALVEPAIEGLGKAIKGGEFKDIVKAAQIVLDRCGFHPKSEIVGADGGPILHRVERVIVDPAKGDGGAS